MLSHWNLEIIENSMMINLMLGKITPSNNKIPVTIG